ncbi:hypothetical protein M3Y97_00049100 [Aphelenchoides bicaudatus]|nr:hypothetical protein M3Y97_00049100 [Aphelenchoides bicaudatus]
MMSQQKEKFFGKFYGVGRYVTKSEWNMKWPDQPSYLRIVKARPEMDRWLHRGKVWAEWTFRGHNLGVFEFNKDLNRADWKLVHKHEESKLLENTKKMAPIELPDSFPLPPLQILTAKRYAAKNKQEWDTKQERAPLELCIDPQFEIYKKFIKQTSPKTQSASVYNEVNPETYLDFYGKLLPTKVEAWNAGPAEYRQKFIDT